MRRLVLAVALATTPAFAGDVLDAAKLRPLIVPDAKEEVWASLPWHTDLHEARRLAATQGRPIFLWEMDGHPLGCT